jgi:hypothetical protein
MTSVIPVIDLAAVTAPDAPRDLRTVDGGNGRTTTRNCAT